MLLKLRKTNNQAIKEQVVQIDAEIQALDKQITHAEADTNRLTYRLYKLTDEEIRLVEREDTGSAIWILKTSNLNYPWEPFIIKDFSKNCYLTIRNI